MIVAQVAENAAPRHQVVVLRRRVHCVHRKPHPAIANALSPLGVEPKALPLTPPVLWRLIQEARQR
jgi:hypothetical protein